MNLSDTFYVALCMTVLILSVVYWFWTQNQYIQRKLNLLENIVYEMKTTLASSETQGPGLMIPTPDSIQQSSELKPALYPPAPSSVLGEDEDLLHEELTTEAAKAAKAETHDDVENAIADFAIDNIQSAVASVEEVNETDKSVPFDLQPGGLGSGIGDNIEPDSSSKNTVLDTMTISELKRLAEQRGITGTAKLRKQALIDAIRSAPISNPFDNKEGTIEFS